MEFDPNIWIDKYGLPLGILAIVGYVVRRACLWVKPYVESFFTAHGSLIESLKANLGTQSESHKETHSKLDLIHGDVREIKDRLEP